MDSSYAGGEGDNILGFTRIRSIGTQPNCDEFLISNEDGLPLKVPQLPGTLKIVPFFYYTILFSLSNARTLQSLAIATNPIIILQGIIYFI